MFRGRGNVRSDIKVWVEARNLEAAVPALARVQDVVHVSFPPPLFVFLTSLIPRLHPLFIPTL